MLKTISLFTGMGGLDFGFELAGFKTVCAVEIDPMSCKTIRLNTDWPLIEGDIHRITSEEIMEVAGLRPGESDILIGGPPCQPFSKSSYWATGDSLRLEDPRADTLVAYLRVLKETQPRAFLLENVHGLAYKGKDEGLKFLLDGIEQINSDVGTNYRVSWKKLNAADYGVPQMRERIFLIGSRDGLSFNFPQPTHTSVNEERGLFDTQYLLPFKTAWDAIGDLQQNVDDPSLKVGGKWGDLLASIPEGENYLFHTRRGGGKPLFGWRTRYWSFLLKLSKSRPSWTIQAQPGSAIGPFHWKNRKLTIQEMCRIQTFPDGLTFNSGRTETQRMIGNAVPSLLAEILGVEIRRQFFGHKIVKKPCLLPSFKKCPPAERTVDCPEKYLIYVGDHKDHPGTGKGNKKLKKAPQLHRSRKDKLNSPDNSLAEQLFP